MSLPRSASVKLNMPRTGVGLCRATVHKWEIASAPTCACDAKEQYADERCRSGCAHNRLRVRFRFHLYRLCLHCS